MSERRRPDPDAVPPARAEGRAAARARINQQHTWVDLQVQQAIERGDFDSLPGAGKPIRDLGSTHDPNWWVKKLVEREHVALLPPSLALRKEDAELDERLDRITVETEVRREVEDFNERVIAARYGIPQGPPLVTMPRDVDETVAGWQQRRDARRDEQRDAVRRRRAQQAAADQDRPPRRWWQRRRPLND